VKKELTTVAFKIDKQYWKYIQMLTHKLSLERGESLNYSDLIREALERSYPIPKK